MVIDKLTEFADAQALSATGNSTNHIDFGVDRDMGPGRAKYWIVQLDVAADAGNADETYSATLETDDNGSFSSATVIATLTIVRGDAAGTRYWVPLPATNERFMRVRMVLGGTTPSLTYSSWLGDHPPVLIAYAGENG